MLSPVIRGTWRADKREYRQRRGVVVVRGNGIEERGSLLLSRHRSQLCPSFAQLVSESATVLCLSRFQYSNPMRLGRSRGSISRPACLAGSLERILQDRQIRQETGFRDFIGCRGNVLIAASSLPSDTAAWQRCSAWLLHGASTRVLARVRQQTSNGDGRKICTR